MHRKYSKDESLIDKWSLITIQPDEIIVANNLILQNSWLNKSFRHVSGLIAEYVFDCGIKVDQLCEESNSLWWWGNRKQDKFSKFFDETFSQHIGKSCCIGWKTYKIINQKEKACWRNIT